MACAPAVSTPGSAYLRAMAAANYGRANRQLLTEAARHAFTVVAGGRASTSSTTSPAPWARPRT
ncbi:RtcB family protein [Streptomyces sp. NPDC059442]|uniref:RtcB family protein n=1 Tax=Streptomyces sp. NPDC059442 TaxID=3346830 RepID=UPI00369044F3